MSLEEDLESAFERLFIESGDKEELSENEDD